jgi:hypothetical protein
MSDSNYAARCRHKRSFLPPHPSHTSGPSFARPAPLDIVDDEWAAETLSDDDIDIPPSCHIPLSQLLDDSDVGGDAFGGMMSGAGAGGGIAATADGAAVASATHSGAVAEAAMERRQRAEMQWNELALDQFDALHVGPITRSAPSAGSTAGAHAASAARNQAPNGNNTSATG